MTDKKPTPKEIAKAANLKMMTEIGGAGLNRQGGAVFEEFLTELQGAKGRRIFTEMSLNDPVAAGLLHAIEMPLRRARWTVEAQTDNPTDIEAAEFIESCMGDMSSTWPDFISEVLTMLVYGWSWFERVLKVRNGEDADPPSQFTDGKIGWRKLAIRGQNSHRSWEFDDEGGIQALIQAPPPDFHEFTIPIQKSLLFRTRTNKGNPEGRSILRTSYRAWYFKKSLETMEAIALERHGAGYPIIYMPTGAGDAELKAAKNIVRNTRMDTQHGITLPGPKQSDEHPDGWLFEFVTPASGSLSVFNDAIVRYRTEMLISTLASFIQLGSTDVGSFALSKDQSSFFQIAVEGWAEMISAVLNRFAVPQLIRLNGFNVEKMPKIRHTDISQHDLGSLGSLLQTLTVAGLITPTAATEDWIRDYIDMPPVTAEEREQMAADERDSEPPDMDAEGPTDEETLEKAGAIVEAMKADDDADPERVAAMVELYEGMVKVNASRHDQLDIAYGDWGDAAAKAGHKRRRRRRISKPFAGYENFAACVADNQDKDDPAAFCAVLERESKGEKS